MNNSFVIEGIPEKKPDDRQKEREIKVVKLIEALEAVFQSREWKVLKTELFDELEASIEKRFRSESANSQINDAELYRLQGEHRIIRKFDFERQIQLYRDELANIRKQTPPPQEYGGM